MRLLSVSVEPNIYKHASEWKCNYLPQLPFSRYIPNHIYTPLIMNYNWHEKQTSCEQLEATVKSRERGYGL